ncbi:MAG TPA: hypothetical protein VF103_16440 [Polyangiaceae bacterium]
MALSFLLAGACVGCGGEDVERPVEADGGTDDPVRCLKPASNYFTNFAEGSSYSDAVSVRSLTYAYPSGLTVTFGDTLRVTGTVSTFAGVGVSFGACVDASEFSGVEFDVGGDVGPSGRVTFSATTRENSPEPPETETGTCEPVDPVEPYRSCQGAYTTFEVSEAPSRQTVRFSSFLGGTPHAGVNRAELLAFFLSLEWNDGQPEFPLDLTVGDLSFVP